MRPALVVAAIALVATLSSRAATTDDLERWSPARIASPRFESHAAFDPRNGDLYFVRSAPDFTGWRILTTRCTADGWSEPVDAPFAGDGVEADPWFSPDGRALWFISTRTTDGVRREDLDVWRVERDAGGRWGAPVRLPPPINSTGHEWFPRLAGDGWLYFGSDRDGGLGKTDIWRARQAADGRWRVENAGSSLNGPGHDYEALPSPDGRTLILMTDDGLYESHATDDGWSPRVRLGAAINVDGSEIGAAFSPSGRSLLFARDIKGDDSGEFFVWYREGREDWPPRCPAPR